MGWAMVAPRTRLTVGGETLPVRELDKGAMQAASA